MQVHELITQLAAGCAGPQPMAHARAVLEGLCTDIDSLATTLSFASGVGDNAEQLVLRSPELSLLKVGFPGGRRTPPHDHGTWALILALAGTEQHTLYEVDERGALRRARVVVLRPGSILAIPTGMAHVVECVGDMAVGLHVYGGDILGLPRRMWDPETLAAHPLDWQRFEQFARKATRADGAP